MNYRRKRSEISNEQPIWRFWKEKGRYNLVEWEVTQLRNGQGGLGIQNLEIHNSCLLMKWLWRFCDEETSLWKEVIVHKFGQNSPWCSNEVNCTYGTGVWRTIRDLWSKLQENSKIRVGNGNNVRFWKDNWIGEVPLQDKFPDLMLLSSNHEIVVSGSWSPRVGILTSEGT
ncbi:hypothetical protein H5410_047209 [Solanum commersonii]|uniref:Uncharacterized protein n=1 Tax=Solanum commersonii TaxID=4109 RepID=A0A9J5XGL0_SOLCO|nr:hypothetical protein H5410_047209 [Solanum commersonii]